MRNGKIINEEKQIKKQFRPFFHFLQLKIQIGKIKFARQEIVIELSFSSAWFVSLECEAEMTSFFERVSLNQLKITIRNFFKMEKIILWKNGSDVSEEYFKCKCEPRMLIATLTS